MCTVSSTFSMRSFTTKMWTECLTNSGYLYVSSFSLCRKNCIQYKNKKLRFKTVLDCRDELTCPSCGDLLREWTLPAVDFPCLLPSHDRFYHKVLIYIEYRAVSGVFRTLSTPPPQRVCPSPASKAGGYALAAPGGEGVGPWGSIFRKTPDTGVALYGFYLSA